MGRGRGERASGRWAGVWLCAVTAVGGLGGAAGVAGAQSSSPDPRLKPVEAGVADRGPLSSSGRVVPADLRLPIGFDRVYKLESASRRRPLGDMFARQSGGVTAVFPRSQYSEAGGAEIPAGTTYYIGNLPESVTGSVSARPAPRKLPANYVDRSARDDRAAAPPEIQAAPRTEGGRVAGPRPGTGEPRVEQRTGSAAGGRALLESARPEMAPEAGPKDREDDLRPRSVPPRPSVFSDDEYRKRRVSDLLDTAIATSPKAGTGTAAKAVVEPRKK